MKELSDWRIICAPGGWVRASSGDGDTTVYMRLRQTSTGQRFNVHTVVMDSAAPISTHVWRTVPFQEVEEFANDPRGVLTGRAGDWNPPRAALLSPAGQEPLSIGELERHFGTTEELREHDAPDNPSPHPHGFFLSDVSSDPGEEPAPLTNPAGRITDDFLGDLARMYRWLVGTGRNAPATVIAEQTGAPVATVRRWVSMARKKGLLPPGRPGRAG